MKIPISKIKPSRRPVRSVQDGNFDELVRSMKRIGQVVPIKVRKSGDGYEVVYGHRRLRAAKSAGLKEIEAIVESVDEKRAYTEAYIENMIREGMTPVEIGDAVMQIAKIEGAASAEALSRLGYGEVHTLQRYMRVPAQPKEVRKLMGEGRQAVAPIGTEHLDMVLAAGLGEEPRHTRSGTPGPKVVTKEGVSVVQKAAKEGLSAPQTRRVAEAVAAAKSPEMKEHLLKTPYSGLLHDKKIVQERPRVPSNAAIKKDWSLTPEVSRIIDVLRSWEDRLDGFKAAADQGKFSPEAGRFVALRMRKLANAITMAADHIARKSK